MLRQDYIKRVIEQVGEAIARALGSKTGAGTAQPDDALLQIQRAYSELGVGRGFFDLEATSLRRMLGSAERREAVAQLCRWEAQVLELKGDAAGAAQRVRLARELTAN